MEEPNLKEKQAETRHKKTYEPPKAIFIPLRIEERLMTCGKTEALMCKRYLLEGS
jgi:hypothetical protein